MEIVINTDAILAYLSQPVHVILWIAFTHGGWVLLLILLLTAAWQWRLFNKRLEYYKAQQYVVLAIDVPRENEQSFKAAEQIFSAVWGIYARGNWVEENWEGRMQLGISFELVSIEGSVQYIVRTPVKYRDVVEAAMYGQYPDVEITEVRDYMDSIPVDAWKDESPYKVWGTQAMYSKHNAYPIRTYPSYEHPASEVGIVDPLAPLLEVLSRFGNGEFLGLQFLIKPVGDHWAVGAERVVKKLIGEKVIVKKHVGDRAVDVLVKGMSFAADQVVGAAATGKKEQKRDEHNRLLELTPGVREALEAIEHKMAKPCFEVKVRHLYVGRKEVFSKSRSINGIWGGLRSFSAGNLNALRAGRRTMTDANYFFVERRVRQRRRKILNAYRERSYFKGTGWLIMSVEELASLWHFPLITVRTPMLRRAGSRKSEPPSELVAVTATESGFAAPEVVPPETVLDLDDKSFEQRFAPSAASVPPLGASLSGPAPEPPARQSEPPPDLPIA